MTTSTLVAEALLDMGAVLMQPNQPFTLTSGKKSPVYVDCRKIIAFPQARNMMMHAMLDILDASVGLAKINVFAGGETAGIPYAAFLAERTGKPMVYVRKKPKGFGRNAQIEGAWQDGANAILIEDLATDGGSKVVFIEAMRAAGLHCAHTAVIFHYGIFPYEQSALAKMGVALHSLCTWQDILRVAKQQQRLDASALAHVEDFLSAPEAWQAKHA